MKGSIYYDDIYAARGLRMTFWEKHFSTRVMRDHCQHGRWLDLGCGCGQQDWYVARSNPVEIVGIDYSPVALQKARTLPPNNLQWVRGDVMALPFASASFDGCICSHTLEHIPIPCHLLAEAVRVTRPGGQLLIIVPHLLCANDPSHIWHFTPAQLTSVLSAYGPVDVSLSPCNNQVVAMVHLGGLDET